MTIKDVCLLNVLFDDTNVTVHSDYTGIIFNDNILNIPLYLLYFDVYRFMYNIEVNMLNIYVHDVWKEEDKF